MWELLGVISGVFLICRFFLKSREILFQKLEEIRAAADQIDTHVKELQGFLHDADASDELLLIRRILEEKTGITAEMTREADRKRWEADRKRWREERDAAVSDAQKKRDSAASDDIDLPPEGE